jgi:hypothetical protein
LTSSSDRRVLDELVPDSTHSARDRQSNFFYQRPDALSAAQTSSLHPLLLLRAPANSPQALPFRLPLSATFIESIHGGTRKRLANSRPARLAFELEARRKRTTILSNVSCDTERSTDRFAELKTRKSFDSSDRRSTAAISVVARQTFQETSGTQWQKN